MFLFLYFLNLVVVFSSSYVTLFTMDLGLIQINERMNQYNQIQPNKCHIQSSEFEIPRNLVSLTPRSIC